MSIIAINERQPARPARAKPLPAAQARIDEARAPKAESAVSSSESDELEATVRKAKEAQRIFATFGQEKVDEIFRTAALAASAMRIPLALDAVAETGMGIFEDKAIKNQFASEYIYNKYKGMRTAGVVERDEAGGYSRIAEPIGVIAGIVPTTNPTSTAIFKALIALKTRNAIVFSPHPRARNCTVRAARIVHEAAVAAGAPEGVIGWLSDPTVESSNRLMKHPDVSLILATGGPGMVKAAYSSGKPAIGVGAGNTPAVIDESADLDMAVSSIILSKTFDNGVICASEQSVIVVDAVYEAVRARFAAQLCLVMDEAQKAKLAAVLVKDGRINAGVVGQSAARIAAMAGIDAPAGVKVLIAEIDAVGQEEPYSWEKLSPVLALYRARDFEAAVERAAELVEFAGLGHTAVLYTDGANRGRVELFAERVRVGRVLVNMPSSQGAIGDVFNFRLEPSLTLGCGSWGGNSVSENVGPRQLLNYKTVAERRENPQWMRLPPKIYHKYGCLGLALGDLAGRKRAFVVTDGPLAELGAARKVTDRLEALGIETAVFSEVLPDPTLSVVRKGVERMAAFSPDVVVALGGGSPMDAAKLMHLMYEHPEVRFEDLALRFMDIRKRIVEYPRLGDKAILVAIPTTSGTGSEVTPFAVITDDATGRKYPLADYALTPSMAIVDAELAMLMPKGLTAAGGIDAVTHALEALVSVMATDYTTSLAMEAARKLFAFLPRAYEKGAADPRARQEAHDAATMAGMAFANAFLGVCHSMAHKLGARFKLPHGVANALLIEEAIRFNAAGAPAKMAAFAQYERPKAKEGYARLARYLGLTPAGGPAGAGGTDGTGAAAALGAAAGDDALVEALIAAVADLKRKLGIPASIKEAGVDEGAFLAALDELALEAFDDQCTGANPRYPLVAEIKEMYLGAYYGK
jgi:acetaldehyde dehydrogenase/alcohol dehydrogenase